MSDTEYAKRRETAGEMESERFQHIRSRGFRAARASAVSFFFLFIYFFFTTGFADKKIVGKRAHDVVNPFAPIEEPVCKIIHALISRCVSTLHASWSATKLLTRQIALTQLRHTNWLLTSLLVSHLNGECRELDKYAASLEIFNGNNGKKSNGGEN